MGLLSYVKPKGKKQAQPEVQAEELVEKPPVSDVTTPGLRFGTQGPGTPGSSTPGFGTPGNGTPWGSRPASLYPSGDFRNSQADDISDIKCDVMVNWLYQQQMERLWTAGGHDEGVVLKKGRSAYSSCPADLVEEPYGFFKAVEFLNVRVCLVLVAMKTACMRS